jgi:hypothetical protein
VTVGDSLGESNLSRPCARVSAHTANASPSVICHPKPRCRAQGKMLQCSIKTGFLRVGVTVVRPREGGIEGGSAARELVAARAVEETDAT